MSSNRRYALIISNSDYQDQRLARLTTPAADAAGLRAVLEDSTICAFDEVTLLENQSSYQVRIALAQFFAGKKRDDLLLLYFSGHGLLDVNNRFYLALQDSNSDYISATSVAAQYVSEQMDNSRARRQIVILDCCHSGAFAAGSKAVATTRVGTGNAFDQNGYGRFILTATDHLQYAWEGDKLAGKYERSLFTHHLVEGLRTGAADLDHQGYITIENLYQYVHDKVRADGDETRRQTPMYWGDKRQGDLIIAQTTASKMTRASQVPPTPSLLISPELADKEPQWKPIKASVWERLPLRGKVVVGFVTISMLVGLFYFGEQNESPDETLAQAVETTVTTFTPQSVYGIEWVEIPAGSFLMGAADGDNLADSHESPLHEVTLDTFWIAKTEVTNEQYKAFVDATGHRVPFMTREDYDFYSDEQYNAWIAPYVEEFNWDSESRTYPIGKKYHPVVQVSWEDAIAYAEWLSGEIGLTVTLPSEAEWEKAARGNREAIIYPWGDSFEGNFLNYCDSNCEFDWRDTENDDGFQVTAPVGSYSNGASPYGVLDMSGNVWEWTRSIYDQDNYPYPYDPADGREEMANTSALRVFRGGSWGLFSGFVRVSHRVSHDADYRSADYGFRVVVLSRPLSQP